MPALLDACGEWLRPVIATLAGAGLRVGEAVALNWRDVSLATGTLTVRESKTDAGAGREVDLPLGLADELRELSARSGSTAPDGPMFLTRAGTRQTVSNVERRLKTAVRHANVALEGQGIEPISESVTPHALRRLYASLRAALRDDPFLIAEQLGHTDPAFTFRVYHRAAKRRERLSGAYLEAFDHACEWARMGTNGVPSPDEGAEVAAPLSAEPAS